MRLAAALFVILTIVSVDSALAFVYTDNFNSPVWNTSIFNNGVLSNTVDVFPDKVVQNQLYLGNSSSHSLDVTGIIAGGIVGQFDVQVDFSVVGYRSNNYERIGLGVENDSNNYAFVERVSQYGFNNYSSESYLTDANGLVAGGTPVPANYLTEGTLRWSRGSDDLMTAYFYDASASAFQQIGSSMAFDGPLTAVNLSIWSISGSSPVDLQVTFGDFILSTPSAATPEPSTMLLMGIGAAGAAFMRRRKGKSAN